MVWINKDVHLSRKVDIKIDLNTEFKLKTYEEYLKDGFFYKLGELHKSLIGCEFMIYDNEVLVVRKVNDVVYDVDTVKVKKKKTEFTYGINLDNENVGYKLIIYLVDENGVRHNINDVFLIQ